MLAAGVAFAAAGLLSGCGVGYYKSNAGTGTAQLSLTRGAMHLGGRSLQVYSAYRDAHCTDSSGSGRLAAMLTYTAPRKAATVDAGQRLYLAAGLHDYGVTDSPPRGPGAFYDGPGMYLVQGTCLNLISFIPQPRHEYDVVQERVGAGSCELRVVDRDTGAPPPDLAEENPRACPRDTAQ
ncbi:hypothetical protein [Lysobacter sp. 1R34A]|uniref:hypothetical protein n=1 Tax=Lysobacter sp. 1R34A TaxID=3445786 RepID=UPI003EEBED05